MQTQAVINHIVQWLSGYLSQSGMKGFVVGVSGGIDSAVTSTLCAMTGYPVYALNMPIFQAADQESRSANHLRWLHGRYDNVEAVTVDLTPAFKSLQSTLPEGIQDDLSMANTRSRLRMVTLYAFSTHHRMLVAGTGNKVEDFGVGFYTKYGDGGVDLSPIADLMKSEVYALAETMGIIDEIIQAPPTDGLWSDNRSDENQIGASYDELEWAMTFVDGNGDEQVLDPRQREVLAIFRRFNQVNRHKMLPIPVCQIPSEIKGGVMKLEAAIQSALEFENRIRDLYLEAVARTDDPAGKKIFQALADDEQHHVDYLNSRLDEWQRDGKLTAATLASTIPDKTVIRREAAALQSTMAGDDRGLKQQMLSRALAMEIETSRFYRELIDQVSESHRAMFARFLEIEDNHVEAVQFELDHLSHTGLWYGFEEFDMESL
jgi:NAD+ synthase